MNSMQKRIAVAGGLILSGMFLFPPWLFVYRSEKAVSARAGTFHADETALAVLRDEHERPAGYALTFRAPAPAADLHDDPAIAESVSVRLDAPRLVVQVIGTALLILTLLIAAASPRYGDSRT